MSVARRTGWPVASATSSAVRASTASVRRAMNSSFGRPGGMGSRNSITAVPPRFGFSCCCQNTPIFVATGTTGTPIASAMCQTPDL